MRAATSMTSAPRSIPTRSTRKSISSPGCTMPRKRAVQPTRRAGGTARPSVAVTTCCAAADSHMPCTIGDSRPASSAAARSVWIGLWSPDTTANGRMSIGAVIVTSRRRRRGVSVALSDIAPPARTGSVSSAAPVRPRIANRSSRVASTVPSASVTVTETGTTRPTSVSVATEAVAVTVNSAPSVGSGLTQVRRVVEVDQAQQTLDNREAGVGDGRTDRGEHRRPAAADERVGHHRQGRRQRRAEGGGDTGVVGDLLGIPRHGHGRGAVMHRRQGVGPVDAGRDRQHRPHGGRRRPRWTPPARRRRRRTSGS